MKQTAVIVVAQWLRIWVFRMEVHGLKPGILFADSFHALYYPAVTVLLEYLDSVILQLFGFCLVTL